MWLHIAVNHQIVNFVNVLIENICRYWFDIHWTSLGYLVRLSTHYYLLESMNVDLCRVSDRILGMERLLKSWTLVEVRYLFYISACKIHCTALVSPVIGNLMSKPFPSLIVQYPFYLSK